MLKYQEIRSITDIATRMTTQKYNGARLVIILGPGDTIGLREVLANRTYYLPVWDVLELARRLNYKKGKL